MLIPRKLIVFIATSLDGYIATHNDNLDFLSVVEKEGEDYGYQSFIETVDTVILGRKTYSKVMQLVDTFPHANKETYVITRQYLENSQNLTFYQGNVTELVQKLKSREGKHIYCDGGATIVNLLLQSKVVDELIISVIPILLGDGIRLFQGNIPTQGLELVDTKSYEKGLVQLHYRILNSSV